MIKICKECLIEKSLNDFYTHPKTKDGVMGRCKSCVKSGRKTERERSMSRILDNKRSKDPKRIKHLSENSKKFRLENPEKYKAELLVNNILRRKYLRLIKPRVSFVSGLGGIIHYHHYDYSKPLSVIPCTPLEHAAFHKGTLDIKPEYIWDIPV